MSDLYTIIQYEQDFVASQYYAIGTGTILFYDYFLTPADEIKYVWFGKRSWAFWLFIVNRYHSIAWQVWQVVSSESCVKAAFYSVIIFVVCTLFGQLLLTARIYAVTMKNTSIAIGLIVITVTQCALGICFVIFTGVRPPAIYFSGTPYQFCVFVPNHWNIEVAYISFSLFHDILSAFLLVVYRARKSRVPGLKFSTLLDTIAKDSTSWFMLVFTSHLVLVMTLSLGRPSIQLLPAPGVLVYLPVMISRIMLSLKKAADSSQTNWSIMQDTENGNAVRVPSREWYYWG